jgi:hypothetical protein
MIKTEDFIDDAGNVKFKSAFRDSMYYVIRDKDKTHLFKGISSIFYTAFAIGYHFDKQLDIAPKSINHVNLVSLDRGIKELMVKLILKRKKEIIDSKDLWREVEKYAEYGIQVLFNSLKEKENFLDIPSILEK